jgi:hypothetical protein
MARKRKGKNAKADVVNETAIDTNAAQEGCPNPASVIEKKSFTSPAGRKYTIIKTTERDATDPLPKEKPDSEAGDS